MKKIISLILSLVMILSFTACGTKAEATWQEHYDLGLKYVNEAKYDEAILAFTKALEIDPKQAPVYIALAGVYVRQENYTAAQETLDKAITEIGETDELLAEKENLNDKQTPQNNTGAEGGIPPQAGPFPSADAVPGVVKTDRRDFDTGPYFIFGYNAEGYEICQYNYNADGSLDIYYISTYDANGNKTRQDCYNADGSLRRYYIYTYDAYGNCIREDRYDADGSLDDYYIYTLDADGNRIRRDHYNADGSLRRYYIYTYDAYGREIREILYDSDGNIYTFEYLYTDGSPVVTMRLTWEYDGVTHSTELTYTMANPANEVDINGYTYGGGVWIDAFSEIDNDGNRTFFDYENGVITRRDS